MTAQAVTRRQADTLAAAAENMPRSAREKLDAVEITDLDMIGLALLAGPANVIMQLAVPAVGYGVYESTVESGNLFKHPVKRTRTTLTYLAVAGMGSPELRKAYRHAVNKAHAYVRSGENSPVTYNAFDPKLQLWVAACLYRGWEDIQRLYGDPAKITEEAYQQGAVMGTTLQMPRELWPATRADFEDYWNATVDELEIDATIRGYLMRIVRMDLGLRPLNRVATWFSTTMTFGFLPEEFRRKMGVEMSPAQRRFFATHNRIARVAVTLMPRSLRVFPFNLLLVDLNWRRRTGRPLV